MANVMKIKYTEATISQLAKAKSSDVKYLVSDNKFFQKSYDEIIDIFKKEEAEKTPPYRLFDKWGRPTILGKLVREYELKLAKLSQTATVKDFLEMQWKNHMKETKKLFNRVKKNINKPSYNQSKL